MKGMFLGMALAALTAIGAEENVSFRAARPVWPQGRETEKNLWVGFRATVNVGNPDTAVLRMTGSTIARVFVNGEFLGYGPARGPKGFFRVDEWPLKDACKAGQNVIAIEVAGYNVNSYYLLDQPSFLQAEVVSGSKVLAATGAGDAFQAQVLGTRVEKAQRYSFQRPFSEVYRVTPDWDAWRSGGAFGAAKLAEQPVVPLLPRIAPYPDFKMRDTFKAVSAGTVKSNPAKNIFKDRSLVNIGPKLGGYPESELETQPMAEVQRFDNVANTGWNKNAAQKFLIGDHGFVIFDCGLDDTGFLGARVRCEKPTRLYFVFDEILSGNDVSVTRMGSCNVVTWDLTKPGEYRLEAFEPNTLRYVKVISAGGACEIDAPYLREYKNSTTGRATFKAADNDLNRIFEAAREDYTQNAVDLFTDCPSRERAGWLCDSFFIARTSATLTGKTDIERAFLQNFLLPDKFPYLPDGMLPMCYPSDHNDGVYIPNWAMWFVLELDEYLQRSGDRAMVDAFKPRVLALVDFFKKYRNSDGLLEKLPSWVFVEWSKANSLVQDVNYPSNMTYAEVLSCVARMYGMPEFEKEAEAMRATIRRQSYDGTFFIDNAIRQKDGTLKVTGERTETCQYYAFFFHVATPQTYPALWKILRDDFGPDRKVTKKHPEIYFANAFIGNYLRFELLSREGLSAQILRETKGYFLKMADLTGTLWENDTPTASCCHGFAGHTARMLYRDVLGVRSIDRAKKAIRLSFKEDIPMDSCEGTLPIGDDVLAVRWWKEGGKLRHSVNAPKGYIVTIE